MISGRCLCGAHRYELEGPLEMSHHCHCRLCRKQHGTAFETVVGVAPERLRWTRGETIDFESSPGFTRRSCATCGSPLPQQPAGLPVFVPAGCLDDLQEPILFHIFTASKASWYEIRDGLPAFDELPPGVDARVVETRPLLDPPGGVRGSCLCGHVRWVLEGEAITARHCHCQRCRRARGAAHASNGVHPVDGIRFTAGEEQIRRYRIPEARFFTQCFCGDCGGKVPTVDTQRGIAIVPLGALDDAPPIPPQEHIWTASIPSWSGIFDDLPRREGPPS
jgi:hypothetical protein